MRDRMNVYFPPAMLKDIADLAARKGLSRSAIVEAAVASFLSRGWRRSPSSRPDACSVRLRTPAFNSTVAWVTPRRCGLHATSATAD